MKTTTRQHLVNFLKKSQGDAHRFETEIKSYESKENRTDDDSNHITFLKVQQALNQNTEKFILKVLVSDKLPTYWEK